MSKREVLRYVGVTGLPGSGKGAFIEVLEQQLAAHGVALCYYSLSNELREEARERDLPITRPVLRDIANELRQQEGSGVLALRVVRKLHAALTQEHDDGPVVVIVDSIRNPEEVLTLEQQLAPHFTLVALEAPIELLVARLAARARADETAEVVQKREAARQMILGEAGRGEPAHGHNILACIEMAGRRIDNAGSLADLDKQAARFAAELVASLQAT